MPQNDGANIPDEVFADGIGWIGFHAGVVRIEFFSFGTPRTADGVPEKDKEPDRVARQRIVMPIEGFMRSLGAMNDLVKKLESGGMILRRPAGATVATAEGQTSATAVRVTPPASSPNFD